MSDLDALFAGLQFGDLSAVEDDDDCGIVVTSEVRVADVLDGLAAMPAPAPKKGRGGYRHGIQGRTATQRKQAQRSRQSTDKLRRVAVLDFETDPFDASKKVIVKPFLAVLYSDQFEPVVIWEQDVEAFIEAVLAALEALPEPYTIYAHNGGSFDYMFFIHKLRGTIMFKGRAVMVAQCGKHELRDSLHIIPEKLRGYKKDDFDYTKLLRDRRGKYRQEIITYCINDCRYLFEIVKKFITDFGMKLSIGMAAMAEIKKHYKIDKLSEHLDGKLRGVNTDAGDPATYDRTNGRGYFYGGRVECLAGKGHFRGGYKLYDVNSMYPYVMAAFKHPIGKEYYFREGSPSQYTAFVEIECDNHGAFVTRGADGETTANVGRGVFFTTIFEYRVAERLGLFSNGRIITCVDCDKFSDFSKFVVPTYQNRMRTKKQLVGMPEGSERDHVKMQDMFYKFLLNNGYGKFAQNPRKFKESYITDPDARPPADLDNEGNPLPDQWGDFPVESNELYAIWQRAAPERRFNNVGTGASITGAARAVLLEAIHYAEDPIYCDTDSLICKSIPAWAVDIHNENLGSWKVEASYAEVIICGKKQYAARLEGKEHGAKGAYVIKSKGVTGLTWSDYERMLEDEVIASVNRAPTLTRAGRQFYMQRSVKATGPHRDLSYAAQRQRNRA